MSKNIFDNRKMELSGMKSFNSIVIIQRKTMIEPEEMEIKQIRRESPPDRPNKSFDITPTEQNQIIIVAQNFNKGHRKGCITVT